MHMFLYRKDRGGKMKKQKTTDKKCYGEHGCTSTRGSRSGRKGRWVTDPALGDASGTIRQKRGR